mmetsp:Transcript_83805/g.237687  ORF Transcript_83805/g.237687 Transcript_83805/m.237687 type:complete len:110 (-) Transcript_83805:58-387(-)
MRGSTMWAALPRLTAITADASARSGVPAPCELAGERDSDGADGDLATRHAVVAALRLGEKAHHAGAAAPAPWRGGVVGVEVPQHPWDAPRPADAEPPAQSGCPAPDTWL